jgi:hypothetical protein
MCISFLQPKIENNFIMAVPLLEVQKSVDHSLDGYSSLSVLKLKEYVCDWHIKAKPREEIEQRKKKSVTLEIIGIYFPET